jgi:CheY-like chemotaxis protein
LRVALAVRGDHDGDQTTFPVIRVVLVRPRPDHRSLASGEGDQLHRKRILVVEDDEPIVEFLQSLLEDPNQRVLVARDGQQGLDQARTCHPDLILLDISLPIVDGWELIRRLKTDPLTRSIPLVAVTGAGGACGESEWDERLDGYVAKPFEVTELEETVRILLARR